MRPYFGFVLGLVLFPCVSAVEPNKEDRYLREVGFPQIEAFIRLNGLRCELPLTTNQLSRCRIEFFEDRAFTMASIRLTNAWWFHLRTERQVSEVTTFRDSSVRTEYDLNDAPKEKVEAVRVLNWRNKLNDRTALALARRFFHLQGHKEENFHPPRFEQFSWGLRKDPDYVPFPFYEAFWYRKDVELHKPGVITQPLVIIEVSGLTSNLVSYSKLSMPVGTDFETPRPDKPW